MLQTQDVPWGMLFETCPAPELSVLCWFAASCIICCCFFVWISMKVCIMTSELAMNFEEQLSKHEACQQGTKQRMIIPYCQQVLSVFSRYFECLLYPNGMWRHFNRSTIYIAPLPEGAPWRCRLGCEHDTLRLLLLRPHAGTQPIWPTCTK